MRYVMSCVLVLLLSVLASTQTRLDFSGVWTRASGTERDINLGGVAGGVPVMTIRQDDSAIRIERSLGTLRNWKAEVSVKLDGSESPFNIPAGPEPPDGFITRAKSSIATWEGNKLALTTTAIMKDVKAGTEMTIVTKEVLSLEGNTLVVDRTHPNKLGPFRATKDIYKKQPTPNSK